MVWSSLGSIQPNILDWQTYNTPVVGGELFRVRQSWVGDWPGSGYLQISAVYADAGRHGYRRVGSDTKDRIIQLPVPEALELAGFTTRYIEIKVNGRARLFESANWTVDVDQWI